MTPERFASVHGLRCYEKPCPNRVEWLISTAAGSTPMCRDHAAWYLDKPPDIYPRERFSANPAAEVAARVAR